MKAKAVVSASIIITSLVVLSMIFHVRATSPPNLSLPDLSGHCYGVGATFSTTLNASNLTGITGWQASISFDPGAVAAINYAMGSQFTGQNTFKTNATDNNAGSFKLAFSYLDNASITTTTTTQLLTITWKSLIYHPGTIFHIVLSSEDSVMGTLLEDHYLQRQLYTTTDGDVTCALRP